MSDVINIMICTALKWVKTYINQVIWMKLSWLTNNTFCKETRKICQTLKRWRNISTP